MLVEWMNENPPVSGLLESITLAEGKRNAMSQACCIQLDRLGASSLEEGVIYVASVWMAPPAMTQEDPAPPLDDHSLNAGTLGSFVNNCYWTVIALQCYASSAA